MQDQMQMLMKASESLSELYSHDFYPPPPVSPMAFNKSDCDHSSHKWQLKTFQLLFSREIERSEWTQERKALKEDNDKLRMQIQDFSQYLVNIQKNINRVQTGMLIMNASVSQSITQLESQVADLEQSKYHA